MYTFGELAAEPVVLPLRDRQQAAAAGVPLLRKFSLCLQASHIPLVWMEAIHGPRAVLVAVQVVLQVVAQAPMVVTSLSQVQAVLSLPMAERAVQVCHRAHQ